MALPLCGHLENRSMETLVVQHTPMVRRLAYHLLAKLPANICVDDLIQAGMLGLLDAAQNYQSGQGAQFETYATVRVRGAMLDELRQHDWLPRRARQKARQVQKAMAELEQRLGRPAGAEEIADMLGISLDEYFDVLSETRSAQILHLEDLSENDEDDFLSTYFQDGRPNPLEILEAETFQNDLKSAIDLLPEREKLVVSLYYVEELNLREIGGVLNISESRTSQLLSQATLRLRAKLHGWLEEQAQAHKAAPGPSRGRKRLATT